MAAQIVTVEPSLASGASGATARSHTRRGADLVERLNALEHEKRSRRHSHAGQLVLAPRPGVAAADRSVRDINDEIRALEAEKQAYRYETRAAAERDMAHRFRSRASSEAPAPRSRFLSEREILLQEGDVRRSRSRYAGSERGLVLHKEEFGRGPGRDFVYEEWERRHRSQPPAELVLYDPERYGPREVVYERAPSPIRKVVRVRKDRKGRMSLVRSAH